MSEARRQCDRAMSWYRRERGVVLIVSYLAVAVFLTLQAAYLSRIVEDHKTSLHYTERLQAMHDAEAGLDGTVRQLAVNSNFSGFPAATLGAGEYDSVVLPVPSDPTLRRVVSDGYFPSRQGGANSDYQQRRVEALLKVSPQTARWAMLGTDHIHVHGDLFVDSYDSTLGPYPNVDSQVGDIVVAQTSTNALWIEGNVQMGAGRKLLCGVNCHTTSSIRVDGTETDGGRAQLPSNPGPPPPDLLPPGQQALIVPPHTTMYLSPGSHSYTSIAIGEGATLFAQGDDQVVIRVSKNGITMYQGAVFAHTSYKPTLLYVSAQQWSLQRDVKFYGTVECINIYNGLGTFQTQSNGISEVFGKVRCAAIEGGPGQLRVHYDKALPVEAYDGGNNVVQVILWHGNQ